MYSAWKMSATFVTMALLLCSCKGAGVPNHATYRGAGIPNYTVYDEQVLDGSKTQVTLKVLTDSTVTEAQLRSLLSQLYEETSKSTGFKYHRNPTHIVIWVYDTVDRANSGDLWRAMVSRMGEHEQPTYTIGNYRLDIKID